VGQNAYQLSNRPCAIDTRNPLLKMFELASQEADAERRRALLTFVVVGGGPTGVETAGALAELIRLVMTKDYPSMDLKEVKVLLLEAVDHLMGTYPPRLSQATHDLLKGKGVDIMLSTRLSEYDGMHARLGDSSVINAHTLIWTAGVRAAELVDGLGLKQAGSGRLVVEQTLQLPGRPEVLVPGDAAHLVSEEGQPLPMRATVAQQEARTAAANIRRLVQGEPPAPFHYKDPGLLATIGRNAAVARLWGLSFSGFIAWVIWVGLHIYRLVGFRNRLVVMVNWAWDYVFYENQVRLITRD
jgi:NADH dehydrogenase